MTPTPPPVQRRRVAPHDQLMLVLAVVSVGLLGYVEFFPHSAEVAYWVFVADACVCGVFLIEFLVRWRRTGWERWFPLRNWYEVLGMIPIAHPALRGLRLLRVIVLVMRLARTADRAFGEKFTEWLVERIDAYADYRASAALYENLRRLSDAELHKRGLRRETLARYAFRLD